MSKRTRPDSGSTSSPPQQYIASQSQRRQPPPAATAAAAAAAAGGPSQNTSASTHKMRQHQSAESITAQVAAASAAIPQSQPQSSRKIYHPRATILLIGMRGVGKTTLGLIGSTALARKFIDMDSIIENKIGQSITSLVKQQGWPAFRRLEANVLRSAIRSHPYDAVIACGGGIVESQDSRELLRAILSDYPVILIIREQDEVLKFLLNDSAPSSSRPQWDEEVREVWRRREPWFWDCASHIFVSLTSEEIARRSNEASSGASESSAPGADRRPTLNPLALKPMEQNFLRLISFILSTPEQPHPVLPRSPTPSRPASPTLMNRMLGRIELGGRLGSVSTLRARHVHMPRPPDVTNRTSLLSSPSSFLSLTVPDLRELAADKFEKIGEGIDAVEIRVDLLDCMVPASTSVRRREAQSLRPGESLVAPNVNLSEVAIQVETARRHFPGLPLLFTVRSQREGGAFHDDRDHAHGSMRSAHSESLYFRLADMALRMGVDLLDIEMAWAPARITSLLSRRGRTRAVVSYHDLTGALAWDGPPARALYERAATLGADIVALYGMAHAGRLEQNWHLLSFQAHVQAAVRADRTGRMPPLTAINMGDSGRPTRPFNPCLTHVAHPRQPALAAPGQMSVRDISRARAALGIELPRRFYVHLSGWDGQETENTSRRGEEGKTGTSSAHAQPDLLSITSSRSLLSSLAELGLPHTLAYFPSSSQHSLLSHVFASDAASNPASPLLLASVLPEMVAPNFGGAYFGWPATAALQAQLTHVFTRCAASADAQAAQSPRPSSRGFGQPEDADPSPRGPMLTLDADLVGAVDVVAMSDAGSTSAAVRARGDVQSELQRALDHLRDSQEQRTLHGGNAAFPTGVSGARRSVLLADHTLPKAIERVVADHLSPINAPNASSSALIVRLGSGLAAESAKEASAADAAAHIAQRAALCAIVRLGFGKCGIVETDAGNAADAATSAAATGGQDADMDNGEGDEGSGLWWAAVLARAVRSYREDEAASGVTESNTPSGGGGGGPASSFAAGAGSGLASPQSIAGCQPVLVHPRQLTDVMTALHTHLSGTHTPAAGPGTASPRLRDAGHAAGKPADSAQDTPSGLVAAGTGAPKPPAPQQTSSSTSRRLPSLIIIVGGSDTAQLAAISSLRGAGASTPAEGEALPPQLWQSETGGVVLRIPCLAPPPVATTDSGSAPASAHARAPTGSSATSSATAAQPSHLTLYPQGWIAPHPSLLEMERLGHGVFEPWTRRRAPGWTVRQAWAAAE